MDFTLKEKTQTLKIYGYIFDYPSKQLHASATLSSTAEVIEYEELQIAAELQSDYEVNSDNNIYKIVNQLEIEGFEKRIPDGILYINGIPVVVFEFKSAIGKAIKYTLKLWSQLSTYTQNGKFDIDNNSIENKIRPLALGRKNYLFAGSHDSAQRVAMMYSFLGSCAANNINPSKWLNSVLSNIGSHHVNKLNELLPTVANFPKFCM